MSLVPRLIARSPGVFRVKPTLFQVVESACSYDKERVCESKTTNFQKREEEEKKTEATSC